MPVTFNNCYRFMCVLIGKKPADNFCKQQYFTPNCSMPTA